ncbi:MAG: beta-propeller fold lactonase family protein, partial [Planctomycetota bacterium]
MTGQHLSRLSTVSVAVLFATTAFANDLIVSAPRADPPGLYRIDGEGKLELLVVLPQANFFKFRSDGEVVYAIGAKAGGPGKRGGATAVHAFAADDDALRPLGAVPLAGRGPCCLDVTPDGRAVLIANYGDGSVEAFEADDSGRLGGPLGRWRHAGSGPVAKRQSGPRAHAFRADPSGTFAVAPDLGSDRLYVYRLGTAGDGRPTVTPADPLFVAVEPGSGPRHVAFHPTAPLAFVTYELSASLGIFRYRDGLLTHLETVVTSPPVDGPYNNSEVRVAPDGRHVTVANRGHDSLAVFEIVSTSADSAGTLGPPVYVSSGGHWPR